MSSKRSSDKHHKGGGAGAGGDSSIDVKSHNGVGTGGGSKTNGRKKRAGKIIAKGIEKSKFPSRDRKSKNAAASGCAPSTTTNPSSGGTASPSSTATATEPVGGKAPNRSRRKKSSAVRTPGERKSSKKTSSSMITRSSSAGELLVRQSKIVRDGDEEEDASRAARKKSSTKRSSTKSDEESPPASADGKSASERVGSKPKGKAKKKKKRRKKTRTTQRSSAPRDSALDIPSCKSASVPSRGARKKLVKRAESSESLSGSREVSRSRRSSMSRRYSDTDLSSNNLAFDKVRKLKRNPDWTISGEFRFIAETAAKDTQDFTYALKRKNLHKNRYGNALPNPSTRVKLRGGDSDYINANWVRGTTGPFRYIAAQAPLPNTFADFWLMVYERNTSLIMMLTRLKEGEGEYERTKAEVYWPRKGPLSMASKSSVGPWKTYGLIMVRLKKTRRHPEDPCVLVREFSIKHVDEEDSSARDVVQVHYTGWPDFGVPDEPTTFIRLLEMMDKYNNSAPVVLHCSAGLGRTGTLMAAHIAMEQLRHKQVKSRDDLDMMAIVSHLRGQRAGMVQTKEQYAFLRELVKSL